MDKKYVVFLIDEKIAALFIANCSSLVRSEHFYDVLVEMHCRKREKKTLPDEIITSPRVLFDVPGS